MKNLARVVSRVVEEAGGIRWLYMRREKTMVDTGIRHYV